MMFGALDPAGLTRVSGEVATGAQQTTFNAMNLFMGMLSDPFIWEGRHPVIASHVRHKFVCEGRLPESDTPAVECRRVCKAVYARRATLLSAQPAAALECLGRRLRRFADHRRQLVLGSNTARPAASMASLLAPTTGSPARHWPALRSPAAALQFQHRQRPRRRIDPTCFRPARSCGTMSGAASILARWPMAGRTSLPIVPSLSPASIGSRAKFNANALSGRVEGGYRFVAPGGLRLYAVCRGTIHEFELPIYAERH